MALPLRSRYARGFTLIELLVVVGLIALLAGLATSALLKPTVAVGVARARTELRALSTALALYRDDAGGYPRTAPRTAGDAGLLRDDAPALCAALLLGATRDLGGGPGSPYLSWRPEELGTIDRARLVPGAMGEDGESGAARLTGPEARSFPEPAFQRAHGPGSPQPLVLLDPWGNPYHYREWASVQSGVRDALATAPVRRTGFRLPAGAAAGEPPVAGAPDAPHSPLSYVIWSNGPNGVNEYGAPGSDDLASWR